MTRIETFHAALMSRLLDDPLPDGLAKEGDLEKEFVLPLVAALHKDFRDLHIYAHPWKQRATCENCNHGPGLISGPPVHGCETCWENSKLWAETRLYGRHCFDLVVGDRDESLVVELKLIHRARKGNRKANDGFQRLIGQCALARLIHSRVIGFCVAEDGALGPSEDLVKKLQKLQAQGIWLIVRLIDGNTASLNAR